MPGSSVCHLCHIHDHAHDHGSTLLRTSPLRHSRKSRSRHNSSRSHHHNAHHDHHHHHHDHGLNDPYHRTDITKLPSALARLSDRSHSLPGSRRGSISGNDISDLPNGSAEDYVTRRMRTSRQERKNSRRSTEQVQPIVHSRRGSMARDTSPVHREPDLVLGTIPRVNPDSRNSTLSRVPSHMSMPRESGQDYYLHVQQNRFKEEARKQRFNLQTVMLIGCYTLLVSDFFYAFKFHYYKLVSFFLKYNIFINL